MPGKHTKPRPTDRAYALDALKALDALDGSLARRLGETLLPFYSWDFACCDCPPSHTFVGVPCIAVGVRPAGAARRRRQDHVRCLRCGRSWLGLLRRRADRMADGGMR